MLPNLRLTYSDDNAVAQLIDHPHRSSMLLRVYGRDSETYVCSMMNVYPEQYFLCTPLILEAVKEYDSGYKKQSVIAQWTMQRIDDHWNDLLGSDRP